MKKTRKLTSIVLLIAMLFLLAAPAMATETSTNADTSPKGSITIDNAVVGQTYTIYRIFDLESYDAASNAYAYKVNEAWAGFFSENGDGSAYVTIDESGYIVWQQGKSVAGFAAAAKKYAETPNSPGTTITSIDSITASNREITFSNLDLGYYLIASDLGALCTLDTKTPNITVKGKTDGITLTKEALPASVSIGDTVQFTITLTIPRDSDKKSYLVHDKMAKGFTFDENSVKVLLKRASEEDKELIKEKNDYDLINISTCGECSFEVDINGNMGLKDDAEIVITYEATLNEKATIGADGNINQAWLNSSYIAETKTYTWDVDIFKFNKAETPLAGATFTLSKDAVDTSETADNNSTISLVKKATNLYRVAMTSDVTKVTEVITDTTGRFTIEGLGAGTYSLTETAPPAGYNQLSEPITIVIAENGQITVGTDKENVVTEVEVLNQTGNELPSTGGMGTTIFYVVGGVLVVGASVLLVTRKRMNAEK